MNSGYGEIRIKRQNHMIGLTVFLKSISILKNKNKESKDLSLYYCIKNISWIKVME